MAVAWVEQITNLSNYPVVINVIDEGRRPKVVKVTSRVPHAPQQEKDLELLDFTKDGTLPPHRVPRLRVPLPKEIPHSYSFVIPAHSLVDFNNLSIPWAQVKSVDMRNNGGTFFVNGINERTAGLYLAAHTQQKGGNVVAVALDIQSKNAWDYIRVRNVKRELVKELEAGSLGSAPGINWSVWDIIINENSEILLHQKWANQPSKEYALSVLKSIGDVAIEVAAGVIGAAISAAK